MNFKTIIREENVVSVSQFLKTINIWRLNPQTINRRILASIEILDVEVNCDIVKIFECINTLDVSSLVVDHKEDDINNAKLLEALHIFDEVDNVIADRKIQLYVAKHMPRTPHVFSTGIEFLLIKDEGSCMISIHKPLSSDKQSLGPRTPFMLQQETDGYASISVYQPNDIILDSNTEWLEKKFFPCILKWMKLKSAKAPMPLSSLSLISAENYAKLYCKLKEKYGRKLIKDWPENTDPMKFVYEDIAIAAYLLLLWEKERLERGTNDLQSFLDLGCGNGLLVHILFSEGHRGLGIDLRRRKIWDLYPPETPLQVSTIIPSSATVYPGVDWIIGNHSDELTPWIPVIAARSSSYCRFFLLPCCSYELNGAKYQRHCASKSQYSEYIDYVRSICVQCGFTTHLDKLRIPSTKRICLIGWERTHEQTKEREDRIQQMLNAKTTLTRQKHEFNETIGDTPEEWTCDFKPRDKVEKVRNCTQLDKALIAGIIDSVSKQLLHEGRVIPLRGTINRTWNAGRRLELREIAESIPRETMLRLRKECGGLQTLLKNHSHIFRVTQGRVEFRIPGVAESINERLKKKQLSRPRAKTKPCWFYENHPNGCPATETECNYKH